MSKEHNTTPLEVWRAFLEYLKQPRTKFDLKDRLKGLLLLILLIVLVQAVVQAVLNWYN